jgi:hypothetical protein
MDPDVLSQARTRAPLGALAAQISEIAATLAPVAHLDKTFAPALAPALTALDEEHFSLTKALNATTPRAFAASLRTAHSAYADYVNHWHPLTIRGLATTSLGHSYTAVCGPFNSATWFSLNVLSLAQADVRSQEPPASLSQSALLATLARIKNVHLTAATITSTTADLRFRVTTSRAASPLPLFAAITTPVQVCVNVAHLDTTPAPAVLAC